MFAGAAREAVFSRGDVIRRIQSEFVPVALKAAQVNRPPDTAEGRLYGEIGRSKPAPQGICVINSSGRVLAWTLSFDDDPSVLAFLDHAQKRYRAHPDASKPCAAQRYMKFPSRKLADVADNGSVLPVPSDHTRLCLGRPRISKGTILARVVGRTVDDRGRLSQETIKQEHYAEDVFQIPVSEQAALARIQGREKVPDRLARLFATYAYLGQLDVRPLESPVPGARATVHRLEFWAQRLSPTRMRIEGKTHVSSGDAPTRRSDGAQHRHEIELEWEGFVELAGQRITDLVLSARGREKLEWGHPGMARTRERDVEHLPAGRPIDIDTKVRYAITGDPVPDADATDEPALRRTRDRMPGIERRLRELHAAIQALIRQGRLEQAKAALDEAIEILERAGGDR